MNLFSAITSWIGAYNALSGTHTGQNIIEKGKQAISPITRPIQKSFTPVIDIAKSAISPIASAVSNLSKPTRPTFFSDEQQAYDKMMADNIPESDAISAIKSRRLDLLGGNNNITVVEQQALKNMQADWLSAKEAAQQILDHRKAIQEDAQKKYESMGTGEKLAKWAVWASLGAVSTIGSSAENILGWGAKKLGFDSLGEDLQKSAQEWKQASTGLWQSPEYSAWITAGNVIGWAGAMLAVPWPTGLLGEWAGLWAKVLAGAGEGALQGAWSDIATTGNTSVKSTLWNAVIWWAIPMVAKWFEQLSKIPVSKIVPTTPSQAWKDISKWLEIWKAIRDTGFSLTKWSLIKKVESKIGDLSGKIDDAINTVIKTEWPKNITMNWITKWLKDSILKDPSLAKKLQGTPIDMKDIEDGINETITAYKKLYWAKKLNLNAQQQLKKDIYNWLSSTFAKADTAKLSARQVVEKQLAKTLKEWIETSVPEVKWLNAQLAPYMEASKRLKAKWSYSGYLTDILAGWFASGNPQWIMEDPIWYMKNFATWVITKRLWTSTAAKTWAAQILKWVEKLFESPTFQKIIINQAAQLKNNQK